MHTFEGTVERLIAGGLGWLPLDDGAVLLPHVVAGDVVRGVITGQRRGIYHGVVKEWVVSSPHRVTPPCPVALSCGGCALQCVELSAHIAIKTDWIRRAFAAVDRADVDWLPMSPASDQRRRVRWHMDQEGNLGFYATASHTVVTTELCMAIVPALQALYHQWELINTIGMTKTPPDALYAMVTDDGIHAVLEYTTLPKIPPDVSAITHARELPVQWWWRDSQLCRPLSRPVVPFFDAVPTTKADIALLVGPDDFVQGNKAGNIQMVQQVLDWCTDVRRVVDLFSGIGNISLPLAASGCEVAGFEMNATSVRAANASAKRLQLPAHYAVADLMGRMLHTPDAMVGADCLILDPPRKGAKKVCQQLHHLLPQSIIMIHCDPASASRDALLVAQQGFHLQAVRGLDLFPFSGHVECMSYWQR